MYITVKVVATDSAVTALSVTIAVTLIWAPLSQHGHYHCCLSAVTVSAVILLSAPSLSQSCARFCCHSAALVFAVKTLCTSDSPCLPVFIEDSINYAVNFILFEQTRVVIIMGLPCISWENLEVNKGYYFFRPPPTKSQTLDTPRRRVQHGRNIACCRNEIKHRSNYFLTKSSSICNTLSRKASYLLSRVDIYLSILLYMHAYMYGFPTSTYLTIIPRSGGD